MSSGAAMRCAAVALAVLVAVPVSAQAPVLLGLDGSLALPLASPQSERFGWGGGLAVGARLPFGPWLAASGRLSALALADGPAPADPSLADPGVGWLAALTVGLRLRIHGLVEPGRVRRGDGAWIELAAGLGITGALARPVLTAGLGWAFEVGPIDLGPTARLEHVVHFDDPIDARSAFLLSFGLEVVFLDHAEPPPVDAEAPPPPDTDGDGIVDALDACPDVAEDHDGDADEDGCPEDDADRDGDGIVDRLDACPDVAEDLDEHDDEDGCPDLDDDADGIPDAIDHCPLDPEIVNGVEDTDGCPDEGLITMVEGRIVLDERVLFALNRSRIRHAARPTLEAIVELWRQHPEWLRVRVEGHADERGTDDVNLELSTRRAERVRDALVELGMPPDLLTAVGYGASRPRDTRGTEAAMEANRRVEFVVVETRPLEEVP